MSASQPPPKLYTPKEAAILLRISVSSLIKLKREGHITYIQFNKRTVLFEAEAIDEFLEKVRFIAGGQVPQRKRKP
jgi:excisionase family DNA binding protein